jgi:hypothetical protein
VKKIALPQAGLETLYGARDANLKHIESLLGVRIRRREARSPSTAPSRGGAGRTHLQSVEGADGGGLCPRQRRCEDRRAVAG